MSRLSGGCTYEVGLKIHEATCGRASHIRRSGQMCDRSFSFSFVAALVVAGMAPQLSAAQDVIRVGAPLPLTGPLSPEGLPGRE